MSLLVYFILFIYCFSCVFVSQTNEWKSEGQTKHHWHSSRHT